MANVTLYHPELKETTSVPEQAVPVLKKSGWTTRVPKDKQPDETKES